MPVLPFTLEMLALRRMTPTAFGTLMALEPALGVLLGLLILHQQPSGIQVLGILLVVLAGDAAQRGGRRRPRHPEAVPEPCGSRPRRLTLPGAHRPSSNDLPDRALAWRTHTILSSESKKRSWNDVHWFERLSPHPAGTRRGRRGLIYPTGCKAQRGKGRLHHRARFHRFLRVPEQ